MQRPKNPLHGAAAIGQAVGAVLGRRKVAKHFQIGIGDDSFSFRRNEAGIAAEAALDGIYVLRTNLSAAQADAAATVRAYKSLAQVEQAFRSLKGTDLEPRPVFHRAPRVRAHVLLCMPAYDLEWHMRRHLAPMLFEDHDPAGRGAQRRSPVEKARPADAARHKATDKRTDPADGEPLPVHSFRTLLADLAALTRNVVRLETLTGQRRPCFSHHGSAQSLRPTRRRDHPVARRAPSHPSNIRRLRSKPGKVRLGTPSPGGRGAGLGVRGRVPASPATGSCRRGAPVLAARDLRRGEPTESAVLAPACGRARQTLQTAAAPTIGYPLALRRFLVMMERA